MEEEIVAGGGWMRAEGGGVDEEVAAVSEGGADADAGEGFADFVRERGDHHLRVAVLLTGDWHAAEDLVQASLVKLYRVWPRLDTGTDPDPYLRRIMVNTQRSWWRARWRRETPAARLPEGAASEGMGGDDIADRQALGALVRQALAGLPRQQRAVLVLRYCEDLSEAEVAGILGCSPGTVKTHAHRGMNALREILGSEFGSLEVNETRPSRRDSG